MSAFKGGIPFYDISPEQAMIDFMESVALKEAALANVLNSMAELLHTKKNSMGSREALTDTLEAIEKVMYSIIKMYMTTQTDVHKVSEMFEKYVDTEDEDLEE